jgi:alkyl hydroperoxide reductase subunit AhpC
MGAAVAVVTFETPARARRYAEGTALPWPLLLDETRRVYQEYNMSRAGFWDVWGMETWWAYAKEMLRLRMPKRAHADALQRGGDVIVDPEGVVRFLHVGRGPADRPSAEMILDIMGNSKFS